MIMKKILALLLTVAMLLTFAACGKEEDPNVGIYEGVSGEKDGVTLTMEELYPGESYLELENGGKAVLVLEGDEYSGKWKLDGEDLDLEVEGEDCSGTLEDGVITFEFADSGIYLTFAMEGKAISDDEEASQEEETEETEETVPEESAITYEDAGYWELVRVDGQDEETSLSAENVEWMKAYGAIMYLELLEDGTGIVDVDGEMPITWQDGTLFGENAIELPYTVTDGELVLELEGTLLVFARTEKPEPVVSEMELAGFTDYMEMGTEYPYTTMCYEDESYDTVGAAMVTTYDIFESASGYEAKDGYEWRLVDIEVLFYDENAWNYGISATTRIEDYYNPQLFDDMLVELDESEEYYSYTSTVIHRGQEQEVYYRYVDYWSDWIDEECTYYAQWAIQVPIGYDGMVVGLQNSRMETYDSTYITGCNPEDFVFFRLYNNAEVEFVVDGGNDDLVGSYIVYAMEQDGEYVDNEIIIAMGMERQVTMELYEDGTGFMTMEDESENITYTDTQLFDSSGDSVNYYVIDGIVEIHLDESTILYMCKEMN